MYVAGSDATDSTVYIEVFEKKTGVNRCRFSTAYFDAIVPKE
jgi:hypothetical protein